MFAFRLWRRVHRPFLLIIFTVSTLLFLTNVSVVSTTGQVLSSPAESSFESDVLPSLDSEQRLKGRMIVNDEDSDEEEGAEMKVELGLEEDLVPVPEMKQLPFCDNAKSRGHQGSSGATKSTSATSSATEGLWGTKDNETSGVKDDEDMLVNSNGLSSGKHILVATLDGQLTLLDYTGKLVWSFCTGHLFSSTISSLQLNDRGKYIKLIPSLTGALYSYDGESLQAMPLNAESLLRKSFKLSQDVVITGGKELRTFGVDVDSGNIKYECGMDGCKSPTTATADLTSKEDGSGVVLVIKKQLQTVRAIDSATGTERWNFSVGTHELGLAGVTEGCYEPSEEDLPGNEEPMPLFRMVIPEGVVDGFDTENKIRWRHKFESPITQAWTLENNRLKIVDPIKTSPLLHESPSLYVGIHKKQLYVQESLSTLKKLQGLYELEGAGNTSNGEQLQIGWKPSSSPAVIEHDPEPEPELAIVPQGSTALAPLHITPFFVYERDQINHPAIEAPPNNSDSDNLCLDGDEEEFEEVGGNHSGVDNEVLLSLATLWFWWKEVLGISLVTAIILNILLMRPMAHFVRRRAIEDVMYQVNAFLRRRREAVLALPAPPSPSSTDSLEVPPSVRNRTVSTSSTQSLLDEPNQTIVFMSQYLNEFEPIECLGRGAFGTVFEARKKIDEQSYAVKRIPLPNREKSRVRVMREVKALAKLDHKNIVRYFNAWIESPPHGWLEKHDPLWNCRTLISPTATYDNSGVGSGDYTSIPSFFAHRKKDYSAILVADKTPDENDSFIVFETGSAPPDEGGSLDSGANFHSKIWNKNQRPSMIEELDDDTDESGSNSNSNRSSSIIPEPEVINSKFFRRPTTLNMPSSTDTSENNNCVVVPSQDGKDGCPPSIMYLYIQQELCQKRTLQDWLRTSRTRKLRQILLMFSQIVEAVEYIHSNNLIHRDLKPSNIFLAGRNGADKEDIHDMTVKIGDFGLATTLVANDSTDEFSEGFDIDLQPVNAKLTGQVGTHLYMSPEQKLHNKAYDHKVDIYSLGLIFFELIVPLCTDMERHNELTRARKLEFPKDFTLSYSDQHDLIRSMLSPDPDLRPDASDIKISLSNQLQKVPTFDPMQSRSKSYPSNLTGSQTKRQRLPEDENKDKKPQGSRRIYKTHSAM